MRWTHRKRRGKYIGEQTQVLEGKHRENRVDKLGEEMDEHGEDEDEH